MKDRLIELLNKKYDHFCDQCGVNKDSHYTENLADYLLENGVIVPPCNVGQIVFVIDYEEYPIIRDAEIIEITKNKHGTFIRYEYPGFRGREYVRRFEHIGKIVFLTREEAKAKLKEGVQK